MIKNDDGEVTDNFGESPSRGFLSSCIIILQDPLIDQMLQSSDLRCHSTESSDEDDDREPIHFYYSQTIGIQK